MNKHACILLLTALTGPAVLAAPRRADEAYLMAKGWLRVAQNAPLHERLGTELGAAETLTADGKTVGYVFALQPRGFIVTSADDTVEPVIAFSRTGYGVKADGSPLAALLRSDLPQRLAPPATPRGALALEAPEETRKWAAFSDAGTAEEGPSLTGNGLMDPPADLRVAPLVQSLWGQAAVVDLTCYNYYTPNNYVCGCNATAWGQIMRYHQYPSNGIGQITRTVLVDNVETSATTRGGNGAGGPYAWSSMPLSPDTSITVAQRQAIGALTHDIGVAISLNPPDGGLLTSFTLTGTSSYVPPFVITGVFGYANTIRFDGSVNVPNAVNANLDAGFPVNIALPNHSVVCDGYGFQSGTAYHHLNMGWEGQDDAWYTLGDIETTHYTFTGLQYVYANIFPETSGEVISGRVLDSEGVPLSGVTISLSPGGRTDVTDGAGIYGFHGVPSDSSVTLTAAKAGYSFASKNVTLGTSQNYTDTCGNRWGNDFTGALSISYRLVSGRIVNSAGNGLANIEVVFSNGGGSVWTDGSGSFAQSLPIGWSGTVTPTQLSAYFEPSGYTVADLQEDTDDLDFFGTLVCHVKANATGANDGSAWEHAYTNLMAALSSTAADREIWVAAGTYKPNEGSRDNAFFFKAAQAVFGGFTGTETRRAQRNWRTNPTVLSGDIGVVGTVTDNCYTVVRGAVGARVDGFTITGGNASYAISGSGTIDELARGSGGGVFLWDLPSTEEASFVVDHCIITGNRANNDQGGPGSSMGAGLFRCLVRNSLLRQNVGKYGSAAFDCLLESCTVVSNSSTANAAVYGGALTNSIVYYNTGNGGNLFTNSLTAGYTCTLPLPLPSGTGNMAFAPVFVNAPAGNFMIATNSPCKNAGVSRAWMANAQDLFGDSRASGTAPDLGAYELQATHPVYEQLPESALYGAAAFAVSVQTRYGWSYRLQYRVSLTSGSWQDVGGAAAAASGDGTIKTLSDAAPSGSQRFYRVVTP